MHKHTIQSPEDYVTDLYQITEDYKRFNQKNDLFNRSIWDPEVNPKALFSSYDLAQKFKKSKGFDHWDYALRNASWHLTDVVGELGFEDKGTVEGFTDYYTIQRDGPQVKAPVISPENSTHRIKAAARIFGAGMVGICEIDHRWVYAKTYNRKTRDNPALEIPKSFRYAIILILPMDYALSKTFPAALSGTTTGVGYMQSMGCATQLAQFITNLGYEAMASMNDTALNIPMAIQAGLGEYGRNGLLITPEFGPNVRIAKVFTDLELKADQPITFGVKAFCDLCQECVTACPAKAIPSGPPRNTPPNLSSHSHIKKWTTNAEKCFRFWTNMNSDCAICIRVCPYHRDYSKWWNRWAIKIAGGPLRKWVLWVHRKMKLGRRVDPIIWWNR